jgi:hypothetical protein
MANGLKYPKAGSYVRVYTKPFHLAWMNAYPSKPPEGIVRERRDKTALELWDAKKQFSPLIDWERVARIEYLDENGKPIKSESPVEAQDEPEEEEALTWQVEGSKGKIYTVAKHGDQWSCTCVAGSFGKACKHVQAKKEEISA